MFPDSKKSLQNIISTLNRIEASIGLVVNYEKSVVVPLGNTPLCPCRKPLILDLGGLEILGVKILQAPDITYGEIIEKARGVLTKWSKHALSLAGLFTYHMQVLPTPSSEVFSQYENLVEHFLWKGKKPKISFMVLKRKKEWGGLALVDLRLKDKVIKASWIFRNDATIQNTIVHKVPESLGSFFWYCNLDTPDCVQIYESLKVDPFWKSVITAWFSITWKQTLEDPIEIYHTVI